MIWLSNSTLARLRDQLKARGQRPSIAVPTPGATLDDVARELAFAEYGPLCEAMFLMMSADGKVSDDEREVLKGALRNLSGDEIRGADIEAMLEAAAEKASSSGREARLAEVALSLRDDAARAEVTFVLASALAFADSAIADEENETLNALAEALGIDEVRANALLDDVEQDLTANAAS